MASVFCKNLFEPQAKRLNFHQPSDAAECKIYEIAGQTVIYSFRSITRNITRLRFSLITPCFIYVFHEPGFLLIRGSVKGTLSTEPLQRCRIDTANLEK